MSYAVAACPSLQSLEDVVRGLSSDAAAAAHVQSCSSCRDKVEEIVRNNVLMAELSAIAGLRPSRVADAQSLAVDGYEIHQCIGQGGQGVVYRAIQKRTKRRVALKLLLGGHFATPRQRSRFEREVELAAGLHHPNIVTVHDSGISPDRRPFLSMEFIEGRPLDQWARSCRAEGTSPQTIRRLLGVFIKVCGALSYAHLRGVLHRDLKPGNILVDANDEPHIVDFGLAKLVDGEAAFNATLTGEFMGTIAYAAPEQVSSGDAHSDARSDVYALGVLLHEMLTGRLPYPVTGALADVVRQITTAEPAAPSRVDPSIPADLDTIALKSMSKDLDRRYQSARDLGEDLRRFLANEPILARSNSTWYVLRKTAHRHRIPVIFAGVFLVFLSAFAVTMAVQARRLSLQRDEVKREKQRTEAALHESTIERVRLVNASGNTVMAERLVWPEFLYASNTLGLPDHDDKSHHLPTDPAYWALWEIFARCPCLATLKGPNAYVRSIVFGENGQTILICFANGAVWSWNTSSGQSISVFTPPIIPAEGSCSLSKDGRNVIIMTGIGTEIWTLGEHSRRLLLSEVPAARLAPVTCKANRLVAYACTDGRWVIYDLDTGKKHAGIPAVSDNIVAATFAAGGQVLVTASDEGHVRVWDIRTGDSIAERTITANDQYGWFSLSANTYDRVVVRLGRRMLIMSVPSLAEITDLGGREHHIAAMEFSPRADRIASTGWDQTVRLWKLADHSLSATYFGHEAKANSIAWSSDGERIATGDGNGVIKLWSATPEAARFDLVTPGVSDHSISYGPNGRVLAVCGASHESPGADPIPITIWDALTRKKLRDLSGHATGVSSIAFSPDGARLASTGMDNTLRLWDLPGGHETASMALPQVSRNSNGRPAFSPDGKRVILGCADGRIRIFDTVEQKLIATLEGHGERVPSVAFRPDGNQFVSASLDRSAIIWDAHSFKSLNRLEGHGGPLRVVRYSHDGRVFATGGDDWKVIIRDAQTGTCLRVLERHRQQVFSLAFSPDDRILASGDNAGTIYLWDAVTGRNLATIDAITEKYGIFGLDFSPDGRTLVAAREQGGIEWLDLTHYDRHMAGNLEYQLARNSTVAVDPSRVAELRQWAAAVMKRAAETQE